MITQVIHHSEFSYIYTFPSRLHFHMYTTHNSARAFRRARRGGSFCNASCRASGKPRSWVRCNDESSERYTPKIDGLPQLGSFHPYKWSVPGPLHHGRKLHHGKLAWNPQKWRFGKRIFLFKQVIFRFHVSFQGCTLLGTDISPTVWHC